MISRNANCYCSLHTFCLLQYKSFFFLFSVQDNILYNPALLLQRLLQRIQTETLLRLMQQDKSISGCLISTLCYPRKKGKKYCNMEMVWKRFGLECAKTRKYPKPDPTRTFWVFPNLCKQRTPNIMFYIYIYLAGSSLLHLIVLWHWKYLNHWPLTIIKSFIYTILVTIQIVLLCILCIPNM